MELGKNGYQDFFQADLWKENGEYYEVSSLTTEQTLRALWRVYDIFNRFPKMGWVLSSTLYHALNRRAVELYHSSDPCFPS